MSRFASRPVARGPKPFAFSYSRLKNFESCPHRHRQIDILKAFKEEESDNLIWGNQIHDAMAKAIKSRTPLPQNFSKYQKWLDRILMGADMEGIEIHAELDLAITEDFQPCDWFSEKAWLRGKVDVLKIAGPAALIGDWKGGKVLEDCVQLAIFAQLVFSHFPRLQKVRTEFIWLRHDTTSREDFERSDMAELWASLNPRVAALKQAYLTGEYPVKPSGLCKRHCPVRSCAHYGGE